MGLQPAQVFQGMIGHCEIDVLARQKMPRPMEADLKSEYSWVGGGADSHETTVKESTVSIYVVGGPHDCMNRVYCRGDIDNDAGSRLWHTDVDPQDRQQCTYEGEMKFLEQFEDPETQNQQWGC